jgi:hypothetical protein
VRRAAGGGSSVRHPATHDLGGVPPDVSGWARHVDVERAVHRLVTDAQAQNEAAARRLCDQRRAAAASNAVAYATSLGSIPRSMKLGMRRIAMVL